jgi:beta-glucosidase
VVRDDRWGRTYEGFSEDREVVRSYAGMMVEGLQGRAGTPEFLGPGKVVATAKHFVGDGGTLNGKDQGDNPSSDEQIRDIHGAGYPPAVEAGVQAVMASYNSVRGEKMHGKRDLLTGRLKGDMGFDGLVVGDWNGHGQVAGCTNISCAASINAGLDMFMAPDSWKGLYEATLAQARLGEIPAARLDDAVRRILRVKLRARMFEKGPPSARPFAGQFNLLGAPAHRAIAREAVRKSLVLLKNSRQILPLSPRANVLVAGDGADNIAKQSGGWTITWQGTGVTKADFPHAQSIYSGIREAVSAAGGSATLSVDGKTAVNLPTEVYTVVRLAVSADGQRIAAAMSDRSVRIWDTSCKELAKLRGHTDLVLDVAFSVPVRLKGKNGQQQVNVAPDTAHAMRAPGPELRADVIDDA